MPRYSTLAYGLAAGLMAVAGVGLVATLAGWPVNVRALGFLFGLCVGAVVFVEWGVWLVEHRHDAAVQRRERDMALMERAARLNMPATPVKQAATLSAEEQTRAVEVHHWRIAVHRFLCAGNAYGFGIRKLAKEPDTKVIAWNAWGEMVRLLKDAGILAGSGDGTGWASGWSLPRWQDERDRLTLPYPKGGPPDVQAPPYRTNTQPQHNGATVIDA